MKMKRTSVAGVALLLTATLAWGQAVQLPAGLITPRASSQSSVDAGPEQTINDSGMWYFTATDPNDWLHQAEPSATGMWTSSGGSDAEYIAYEFDQVYALHEVEIWNHGQADTAPNRALKKVHIDYSLDPNGAPGETWTRLMDGANDYFILSQPPGSPGFHVHTDGSKWYFVSDVLDFAGIEVRQVRITSLPVAEEGTYGDSYRGLAEIRFYVDPPTNTPTLETMTIDPSFIKMSGITATASSFQSIDTTPQKAVDRSGMWVFDDPIGERHQNADWGGLMWMSGPNRGAEWINLDLGARYDLQVLEIWNLSQLPSAPGRSMRNMTLEISADGVSYTVVDDYTLRQPKDLGDGAFWHYHASGDTYWFRPTDYIDCGGVAARHVRITSWPVANWGSYGEDRRGLAEVQVYVTTPAPDPEWPSQLWIEEDNITASASSYYEGWGPDTTVNSLGMTTWLLHDNEFSGWGAWISQPTFTSAGNPAGVNGRGWIRYDFDAAYPLGDLWVWNNNQPTSNSRGMRNVYVHYLTPGNSWVPLGEYEIPKAQGLPSLEHGLAIDFGGVDAKAVLITAKAVDGSWGSVANEYSLSEVRFGIAGTQYPDLDDDKDVDWQDVAVFAGNWLAETPGCDSGPAGDHNGDCRVDFRDWGVLLSEWLNGVQ